MKTVIITGISRGLGYELCECLSDKNVRLVGIGRSFGNNQNAILKLELDLSTRGGQLRLGGC